MSAVHQAIILAAGRGNQADGIAKALIHHPRTRNTVLQHAIEAFDGKRIIAVVGYRAIQIMETHPEIDYVINHEWSITNNAFSLGLALNDEPTYVVSGDIFFDRSLIEYLDRHVDNMALTEGRENRQHTSIHCIMREDGSIASAYQGMLQSPTHPEAIGLFKISDSEILCRWKRLCLENANRFAGQVLPFDGAQIMAVNRENYTFDEINTATDYLRLKERVLSR